MIAMVNDTYPFNTADCTCTSNKPVRWTTNKTSGDIKFVSTTTK